MSSSSKSQSQSAPLIPGQKIGNRPYHPDVSNWIISGLTCVVLCIGLFGYRVVASLERSSEWFAEYMLDHSAGVYRVLAYFRLGALLLLAYVLGTFVLAWLMRRWYRKRVVRGFQGTYLVVVMPRPDGASSGSTNTNADAPFVFWDRLLTIVQRAKNKSKHAYLSLDLWGNSSGRVDWGVYLPAMMSPDREAIRRLITADRPQARVVETKDPLAEAMQLDPYDLHDTGERYYASALVTHHKKDYLPLPTDGLAMPALVSTLRPRSGVLASGVSLIAQPEPYGWTQRVNQLYTRRAFIARNDGRAHDELYKTENEAIRLKAQQTIARMCVRVQVVAKTREAAMAERDALVTALSSSKQQYRYVSQVLKMRQSMCIQLVAPPAPPTEQGRLVTLINRQMGRFGLRLGMNRATPARSQDIPADYRVRAPMPPNMRVFFRIPFFPFC